MRYARIVNNVAAEIITAPIELNGATVTLEEMFPQVIIDMLTAVDDTVEQYDVFDPETGNWSHSEEP